MISRAVAARPRGEAIRQTVGRYLADAAWQYALSVNPMEASLPHATVERYLRLSAEHDRAGKEVECSL